MDYDQHKLRETHSSCISFLSNVQSVVVTSHVVFQVVGEKRILLYHPDESGKLYPHEGSLLNNTAQVDPEEPDYKMFPKYENAFAWECHLKQGEMLYIPPKWWHHVRSLSTSFSVSFWWT